MVPEQGPRTVTLFLSLGSWPCSSRASALLVSIQSFRQPDPQARLSGPLRTVLRMHIPRAQGKTSIFILAMMIASLVFSKAKCAPVHRATQNGAAAIFNKKPHPVAMTTTF